MRGSGNLIAPFAIVLAVSLSLVTLANSGSAQDLDLVIRETITIPAVHSGAFVRHVGDLDNDDDLDIAYTVGDPYSTYVMERVGDAFELRATLGSYIYFSAEIDGDVYPEILATIGLYTATIYETIGDNSYTDKFTMTFPSKIEPRPRAGDSDGDGKREILIPAEWTGVRIYEADGNDSYGLEATLVGSPGGNGNISSAGVYDLDGDGHPETVFTANPYNNYQNGLYVFSEVDGNREQTYYSSVGQYAARSLGDLDGNGLGEIVGVTSYTKELVIYESQGANDQFQIVCQVPVDAVYPYSLSDIIDFDEDGQSELWRPIDEDGSGHLDGFTLAHREGGAIVDFYNSGELLEGYSGDIRGLLAIDDTNGDGGLELAVVQGDQIHILEQQALAATIDIKPGSDPNSIACDDSLGTLIPVAILTTDTFDAMTVDHETVTFEGAMEAHRNPQGMIRHEKDVDADGDLDLVFHFIFGETDLTQVGCPSTGPVEAVLTGETFDGERIEGSDTVRLVLAFRGCGLGSELALLLAPLMWLWRRRSLG